MYTCLPAPQAADADPLASLNIILDHVIEYDS